MMGLNGILDTLLPLLRQLGVTVPWMLLLGGGLVLFFYPDKIEQWSALLWKAWSKILRLLGFAFNYAQKQYVKHDLQSRVNAFVRRFDREVPTGSGRKCRVEWVDPATPRKSFIANDRVVLCLRREDPEDHNFIHGAYLFVSSCLVLKAKRYVSPSFREALDLFMCSKLLKRERPELVGVFVDEYLHPKTDSKTSRVGEHVDDFAIIDDAGLFSPTVVQELEYLGNKVFGNRNDARIMADVSGLVALMKSFGLREVGVDEAETDFNGSYCRFGIVIVGKPLKLRSQSFGPYVNYIRKHLVPSGVETIYLLSRSQNKAYVNGIRERLEPEFEGVRTVTFKGILRHRNSGSEKATLYLAIVRKLGVGIVQPSLPRPRLIDDDNRQLPPS